MRRKVTVRLDLTAHTLPPACPNLHNSDAILSNLQATLLLPGRVGCSPLPGRGTNAAQRFRGMPPALVVRASPRLCPGWLVPCAFLGLQAIVPEALTTDCYPLRLQLQIDERPLPDIYSCTIRKHVNNRTTCVSYRLQGANVYNSLRGLFMRGLAYKPDEDLVRGGAGCETTCSKAKASLHPVNGMLAFSMHVLHMHMQRMYPCAQGAWQLVHCPRSSVPALRLRCLVAGGPPRLGSHPL